MNKETDFWQNSRNWLARQMGVDEQRKTEVYLEISQSATLRDATYWLQIVFAAGIATLGLVLSSPAVIIGAMLISPLMGPILSLGLSLAAGDFILLVRAIANLTLSCLVAISFAVLLIFTLPFKEATAEILARTTPNTLDLGVALFSGAIGTIATCRPVKGVITSIPGVAIAVALMPPLCVVGFGVGVAFSLNVSDGMQIAKGGGLLFLTNLVAISFSSLLVFLALQVDTERVRERVKLWEANDQESLFVQNVLCSYSFLRRLRPIGSLPGRLFVAALTILALLVPLSNAFVKLSEEVSQKRQQNSLRRVATNLWQDQFSNEPDNQPRSSIERIIITEQDQSVKVKLNVFTSRLYSPIEKEKYTQELAKKLNKNPQQVQLFLTEIPTASNELLAKKEEVPVPAELKPPNFGDLKLNLVQSLNTAIADLSLPPTVQMLDYSLTTGKSGDTLIAIAYLGENPLSEDAQTLVAQDVRRRIGITQANVSLDYINPLMGEISFDDNAAVIPLTANTSLDEIGKLLKRYPSLDLSMSISLRSLEPSSLTQSRSKAIASYLESKWQVDPERLRLSLLSNIRETNPAQIKRDGSVSFRLGTAATER
jgi:uncharacterized hydrophobic protein (TIGR00271 family)